METLTELKELAENLYFRVQKQKTLYDLTDDMIDLPIIDLINGFNSLPYCFTLQSCYGHFVLNDQKENHNLAPLPVSGTIEKVVYRIAYIAFCIENIHLGRGSLSLLSKSWLSIQKTFNSVVQNGSGKDRSILMHCK